MIPISQRDYILAPRVQSGHHYSQLVRLRPRIRKEHYLQINMVTRFFKKIKHFSYLFNQKHIINLIFQLSIDQR